MPEDDRGWGDRKDRPDKKTKDEEKDKKVERRERREQVIEKEEKKIGGEEKLGKKRFAGMEDLTSRIDEEMDKEVERVVTDKITRMKLMGDGGDDDSGIGGGAGIRGHAAGEMRMPSDWIETPVPMAFITQWDLLNDKAKHFALWYYDNVYARCQYAMVQRYLITPKELKKKKKKKKTQFETLMEDAKEDTIDIRKTIAEFL